MFCLCFLLFTSLFPINFCSFHILFLYEPFVFSTLHSFIHFFITSFVNFHFLFIHFMYLFLIILSFEIYISFNYTSFHEFYLMNCFTLFFLLLDLFYFLIRKGNHFVILTLDSSLTAINVGANQDQIHEYLATLNDEKDRWNVRKEKKQCTA